VHISRKNVVLTAIGVSLLGFVAAPVNAAPVKSGSVDNGDVLQTISQAYLTSHPDLTPQAALAAARAQTAGEQLKAEITKQWSSFGGGWFDPYTATYHLAVTSEATGKSLAATGAHLGVRVSTPLVGRSLDQLTAQADALRSGTDTLAKAANGNVGIDIKTNQVVAEVPQAQLATLARRGQSGVSLLPAKNTAVEADACTSRANCDDFLAAGLVIRNGSGAQVCSLGFTARNSAGQRITLTAGHCSTGVGETWSNGSAPVRTIGAVSGRIDSGNQDVTRIVSTNAFYDPDTTGRAYVSPPAGTVALKGKSFLLVGDTACLSASFPVPARSGNPCGTVGSTSDAAMRGMVRIDGYDACPGDSGGGWYWLAPSGNRYAVALHSRSTTGCNAAPATSWSSPLNSFYSDLTYETS
jgi:streptogrisin C